MSLSKPQHSLLLEVPQEIHLTLYEHLPPVNHFFELKHISKYFHNLSCDYETSICKGIIQARYAIEAACFPPEVQVRGYYMGMTREWWYHDKVVDLYWDPDDELDQTFKPNSYAYIRFLISIEDIVSHSHRWIHDGPLGLGRNEHYQFFVILYRWSSTIYGYNNDRTDEWPMVLKVFSSLPKKTQLAFNAFVDDVAARLTREWPFACSLLGQECDTDAHYTTVTSQPNGTFLPDDVTASELRHLGIDRFYAKWLVLSRNPGQLDDMLGSRFEYGDEVHQRWFFDIDLQLHDDDETGGYFSVGPAAGGWISEHPFCNPMKVLEQVLSLPQNETLPSDSYEPYKSLPTATFLRADYWNGEGWWWDRAEGEWVQKRVKFSGDWTDHGFILGESLYGLLAWEVETRVLQ
ncbi:MAG: hypothetical protein M1812_004025 [Candelaria pacifica]|nr:MAG: hypothetical protein M1812_004025 [Candelaria pacifica]